MEKVESLYINCWKIKYLRNYLTYHIYFDTIILTSQYSSIIKNYKLKLELKLKNIKK